MGRWFTLATFLTIVLVVLASLHAYLWLRLVRDPAWPSAWSRGLAVALVAAGLSMPIALLLGRKAPHFARVLAWPAFVWMGLLFLLFVALVVGDAIRAVGWVLGRAAGVAALDAHRRQFLARAFAGIVTSFAGMVGVAAMREALGPVAIRRLSISLPKLPPARDGTTIVQLTDIHVGQTIGRGFIETIVRRTNELRPDIVAITGDLVDGSVTVLRDAVAPLAGLRARDGVYFVTGNHEYFSGAAAWVEELGRLGIRVLRNERVPIGDGASGFDLAGTDDPTAARFPDEGHGENLQRALADRDRERAVVLLAHQPRTVREAARYEVDLQLSGHTHGGQIWPFTYLVKLQQPFVAGLGTCGPTRIYVSRGTGYWGPPMRWRAPAEITEITLRSGRAAA